MAAADSPEDVTRLLDASRRGDESAAARLAPIVYDELHRLAAAYMRRERADHTLQPTALVHEAYLRLVGTPGDPARSDVTGEQRDQFIATAAVAMRRILVNHALARKAAKRGGGQPVLVLDDALAAFEDRAVDMLVLDEALIRLAERDATQARIVELRFFGGLSVEHCAEVLGVSPRTVQYEWAHARAWLREQLESD